MKIDSPTIQEEELHLQRIKEILLKEDRVELSRLRHLLENDDALNAMISPHIERHIEHLKNNFPSQYNNLVSKIFEEKLINSREEIVDMLSPSIGLMIQKYVSIQFAKLKEGIDNQLKTTFSVSAWGTKLKSSIFGLKESDLILTQLDKYEIQEVYLIQKDSGLLFGSASRSVNMDQDVIAGMMTAIKAFAEDAFKQNAQDLDLIQYGNYKLLMQNFKTYYIAMAITGSLSAADKEQLSNNVLLFADKFLNKRISNIDQELLDEYSEKLKTHFLPSIA